MSFLDLGNILFFVSFAHESRKPGDLPDCVILDSWVFDNFTSADKLFLKALQSLEACVSVYNNSCWKLISSIESPTTFDERFKVTSALFFIPEFNFIKLQIRQIYIESVEVSHFVSILN